MSLTIIRGWASDYAKSKFGVEIDDAELIRIMAEAGFAGSLKELEDIAASMKASDVYLVLDAEALMFVHHTLSKAEPQNSEKHLENMKTARRERDAILAKYRPEAEPVG